MSHHQNEAPSCPFLHLCNCRFNMKWLIAWGTKAGISIEFWEETVKVGSHYLHISWKKQEIDEVQSAQLTLLPLGLSIKETQCETLRKWKAWIVKEQCHIMEQTRANRDCREYINALSWQHFKFGGVFFKCISCVGLAHWLVKWTVAQNDAE